MYIGEKPCYILLSDNKFKYYWNLLMMVLMLYVAIWVPFSICMLPVAEEEEISFATALDYFVDFLFLIDMILMFFSAYDDPTTGLQVVRPKLIAQNYISGWFFIDVIALLPIDLMEQVFSNGSLKLARLARLPRLYRLFRMLRMIKMLRVFRRSSEFKDWFNSLDISLTAIRILKMWCLTLFLMHLMSCIWYLFATLEDDLNLTWVGYRGIVDETPWFKYVHSFYWVNQTITTVGYGDFTISTTTEFLVAIMWILVGQGFYQFVVSLVSSIIAAADKKFA